MKLPLLVSSMVLLSSISMAQVAPPHNSVTLTWTNPTMYVSGQPLTIGQVSVLYDNVQTGISGAPTTFTTPALTLGSHTFTVVVCDNQGTPGNCSQASNPATVNITATGALVVPPVGDLRAVVNP